VFGAVPIGDAFLAWAKSDTSWVGTPPAPPRVISWWWRVPLLLLFLVIAAAPWLAGRAWRRRKVAISRTAGSAKA
jgi:hypothetical protein